MKSSAPRQSLSVTEPGLQSKCVQHSSWVIPWAPIVTIILTQAGQSRVGISGSFSALPVSQVWLQCLTLYHSVPICLPMPSYDCWCSPQFRQRVSWVMSFFTSPLLSGKWAPWGKKTSGSRKRGRADFHSPSLGGQVGLCTQRKGWASRGDRSIFQAL